MSGDAIDEARVLAAADLARFDEVLIATLARQEGYLTGNELAIYRGGKKLRPLLLLLSARSVGASDGQHLPERVIQAAVSLEMLHVATLIHDDIIDLAPVRRGARSLNAAHGNDQALLLGDLQFVEAIRCFADAIETADDLALVRVVLETGSRICRGELDELRTDARQEPAFLRERHLQTIDRKTAVLFGLACEAGAALMRAGKKAAWYLGSYGRALGRAFQIIDDLADIARAEERSGKRRFNDLHARRLSLPIIYAMEELGSASAVTRLMTGETGGAAAVEEAGRELLASGAFMRAYAEARRYGLEASRSLELLPDTPWRRALERIACAIIDQPIDARTEPAMTDDERPPDSETSLYEWLISQMYKALIEPSRDLFLPKLLLLVRNPTLDPFTAPRFPQPPSAPLGPGARIICKLTAPEPNTALPAAAPDLTLSEVVLAGCSNLLLRVPSVKGQDVTLVGDFSKAAGYAPHLTLKGKFTLHQQCCIVPPGVTACQPSHERYVTAGSGDFEVKVAKSMLTGVGRIDMVETGSGKEPEVKVASVAFAAEPEDISVAVEIRTIEDPEERKHWNAYAAGAFQYPATIAAMIAGINKTIADPDLIKAMGTKMTEIVRDIIKP